MPITYSVQNGIILLVIAFLVSPMGLFNGSGMAALQGAGVKVLDSGRNLWVKIAVPAEKLETIISRTITNTRMRDFYDIYILCQIYGKALNAEILHDALYATARKRGTGDS